MSAKVELTDNSIIVTNLVISNPDALAFVRQVPEDDRESTVSKALEVGLFCLERGRTTQDVDFVKRQVQELLQKVETAMLGVPGATEKALVDKIGTDNGQVLAPIKALVDNSTASMKSKLDEVKGMLANDLDPKNSTSTLAVALFTLKTLIDPKHADSVQMAIEKAVSSVTDEKGALAETVRNTVEASIKTLKDEVDGISRQLSGEKMVADALANTTSKGYSYEDEVADTLAAWAKISRGRVEKVGEDNQPGDFVIDCQDDGSGSSCLRIVVEARDRTNAAGRQKISQDLAPKFRERNANAAIYVSKTLDGLAKEIGDWGEGHCDGGPWVACTHANLALALRFLLVDQKIKKLREARPDIDGSAIHAQAQAIRTSLGRVKTIKSKVTALKSTTTDIETEADTLRSDITSALTAIEEALRSEKKDVASVVDIAAADSSLGQEGTTG
jgi:hypothetical protein